MFGYICATILFVAWGSLMGWLAYDAARRDRGRFLA